MSNPINDQFKDINLGYFNDIGDYREYYYLIDIQAEDPPAHCLFNLTTLGELLDAGKELPNVIKEPSLESIDLSSLTAISNKLKFD